MPYQCDANDGQAAVMLITDLNDGTTTALCGPHIPSWVAETYAQLSAAGVYDEPAPSEQSTEIPADDAAAGDGEPQDGSMAASDDAGEVTASDDTPPF